MLRNYIYSINLTNLNRKQENKVILLTYSAMQGLPLFCSCLHGFHSFCLTLKLTINYAPPIITFHPLFTNKLNLKKKKLQDYGTI